MSSIARIKQHKRSIINQHAMADNRKAFAQVVTTFVPLSALWWVAVQSAAVSYWLTAGVIVVMSLFLVRVFVLMHDCGHGSLFRTAALNKSFGFAFEVVELVHRQHCSLPYSPLVRQNPELLSVDQRCGLAFQRCNRARRAAFSS